MTRTATILWCILIGALTGVYAIIWANLPTVQNYMWIAFIALPLYFCCGADPKLFLQHAVCAVCGVLWGVLTLALLEMGLFANPNVGLFVILLVVVGVCCIVHMVVFPPTVLGGVLSNAPMVFGGYAGIFSQGRTQALGVIATLIGGLALGVLIHMGGLMLRKAAASQPETGEPQLEAD
ncbi:MAG: DUF1097 domain-containing protein [Deltaproteobacteria bacterium]|nr:DUF1097 domain-containing protein [Deltaproteobacteria bacterium]